MSDEQPNYRWKKANKIIQAFSTRDEGYTRGATEQQLSQRPLSEAPPPRRRQTATTGNVHSSLQATSAYSPPPQGQGYPPQLFGQPSHPSQNYPTTYGSNSPPPSNQYLPTPSIHQCPLPPQQSSTPHQQYPPPLTHYNSSPSQTSATYGQSGNYASQVGAYPSQTVPPPRNYGGPFDNHIQESYQHSQQGQSYGSVNRDSTRYAPSSNLPQQGSYQERFTTGTTDLETCHHGTRITIMSCEHCTYEKINARRGVGR